MNKTKQPVHFLLNSIMPLCGMLLFFSQLASGQPYPGKVTLKDNSVRTGYIDPDQDNGILFGENKTTDQTIAAADIQSYTIDVNGTDDHYIYIEALPPFSNKPESVKLRAMKIVKEGSITLYEYHLNSAVSFVMGGDWDVLYVKRDAEAQPTMFCYVEHGMVLGSGYKRPKFKQFAADYFKGCDALVAKINKGDFKPKHALDIVEFFNNQCK